MELKSCSVLERVMILTVLLDDQVLIGQKFGQMRYIIYPMCSIYSLFTAKHLDLPACWPAFFELAEKM